MKKFFADCRTLDELKKAYKRLAMQYHPDRHQGEALEGYEGAMKAINAQYQELFDVLKNRRNSAAAADKSGHTKPVAEAPEDFIAIIAALLKLDGLEIELCGRWLWITGSTWEHKDALKAAGCRWAGKKKAWYWHAPEDWTPSRGKRSMEDIRQKYGSERFRSGAVAEALPA